MITIVIPTFNRTTLFNNTLTSVINQSFKETEIIVVDDNSNEYFNNYIIKCIKEHNREIKLIKTGGKKNGAYARNLGLKQSKGEYICFIDDDDTISKEFIIEHYRLCSIKNFKMTACEHYRLLDNRVYFWSRLNLQYNNLSFSLLNGDLSIPTSTLFFDKRFLLSLNGFDESFNRHQDLELLLRVFEHTNLVGFINRKLTLMHTDGHRNYPSGNEAQNIKVQFFKKFDHIISKFNPNELEIINRYQYRGVASFYLREFKIRKAFAISRKYIFNNNPLNNFLEILKTVAMSSLKLRVIISYIINIRFNDRD